MPLEATMMIIDNSEYMRNGDYIPSRFEAQSDAVKTIFQTKIDSNPENTVGVMTMANKGPEVLVTHSKDIGQIIKALHVTSSKIGGSIDIPTAINIAQLALKHRENKNLRQRIIVFVGSPLQGQGADEREMVKLAKRLKKNNVAVDFVAFGDGVEEETNVLKAFVDNTANSDNSHLVSVPPGTHLLSDVIISSPILSEDRGIPPEAMGDVGGASGSGGANFEFGVDPSLDPELALALRMSMEEEQARQAAEEQTRQSATDAQPQTELAGVDKDDEAMLAQALAMSERNDVDMGEEQDEDMDEEEAIARAIQMSMKQEEKEQGGQ
jgi:26S proteasome regulatory subunit N10